MSITRTRAIACILFPLICLFGLASCEKDGPQCYEPTIVRAAVAFIVIDTQTVKTSVDSITQKDTLVYRFKDSSMLPSEMKILNETLPYRVISTEKDLNVMHVAFNPDKDSTSYTFRADTTASSLRDTITFFYSPVVHFISNSCGYNYYYNINNVKFTRNLFDSVAIVNSNVTNNIKDRHVQLYFKRKF